MDKSIEVLCLSNLCYVNEESSCVNYVCYTKDLVILQTRITGATNIDPRLLDQFGRLCIVASEQQHKTSQAVIRFDCY
jgi:hypothetical protein